MLGKIWYILLTYVVNSFCFSLDIPVLISILQEKIKILLQKMLKGTHLYWLCNDASEKNNSLTDRFKKPRINWWLVPCCNTNTRPSFFNTRSSFWFSLKASKARPSVWKAWPSVLKQALLRIFLKRVHENLVCKKHYIFIAV